jgi:N-acetylmuramoyl-L-alanine amidase
MRLDRQRHVVTGIERLPVGDFSNGGRAMPVRRCAVLHFTAGGAAKTSWGWWQQAQNRAIDLGAHFLVERDGTIYQCRALNRTISHAGVSRWRDPNTGSIYRNLNACSIGIELANTGDSCGVIKGEEQLRGYAGEVRRAHRNGGGVKAWEAFGTAQVNATIELLKILVSGYNLDDITGHDCIAPERKNDPGPAFPMQSVREAVGFIGLPVVHRL